MGIDRRERLDALAEEAHILFVFQINGLNQVDSRILDGRRDLEAHLFKDSCREDSAFDGLCRDVRCHEEALEKEAVPSRIGAEFVAQPRSRQVVGGCMDQFFLTGNITACRGDAATGILDERPGDDIGTGFNRFFFGSKFTVAVIDKTNRLRTDLLDDRNNRTDIIDRQRGPRAVTARTLNEDQFRLLFSHGGLNTGQIIGVVLQGDFFIADAFFLQRMGRFMGVADNALHRIIWCADKAHHEVACLQQGQQDRRQRMGPRYEMRTDNGFFRFKDAGKDFVELFPAHIAVTIARRTGKLIRRNLGFLISCQDFRRIMETNRINPFKLGRTFGQRFFS